MKVFEETILAAYRQSFIPRLFQEPSFSSPFHQAEIDGRPLTDEEKEGFAYLAFARGRDTIIHTLIGIIAYFAKNPEDLDDLRAHPEAINTAAEEFFRLAIPLTHIGRVCPAKTDVQGFEVEAGGRISLTWAAANRDPEGFENPNEVNLERKPNPHVAFGFGHHNCLGAHHARAIMRSFLEHFPKKVARVNLLEEVPCMEVEKDYARQIGFNKLIVQCEVMDDK
jgi:cytochrome P450